MHASDNLTALNPDEADRLTGFEQHVLARRIEEASLNAWPAMQQVLMDGWILRFSRGFTKRSNSVIPIYASSQSDSDDYLLEKIRHCENLYAAEQLQTVFRLTSLSPPIHQADDDPSCGMASGTVRGAVADEMPKLDQLLEARGYTFDDTSLVLTSTDLPADSAGAIEMLSLADWLPVYCQLTGMQEPTSALHGLILRSIAGNCGFAVITADNQPIACGLAVVERDLVGLFDIFTHPDHRGRGIAGSLVQDLLAWASSEGAARAYLQMIATNEVAARLYKSLNFTEIYRYWYRISN